MSEVPAHLVEVGALFEQRYRPVLDIVENRWRRAPTCATPLAKLRPSPGSFLFRAGGGPTHHS
jgi:hypothetical protein